MQDVLVGVNYFAGWWDTTPNKWQDKYDGHDWRQDYPERVPLIGEYNTQEITNKEIIAASDYGIDFFSILWYYIDPDCHSGDSGIHDDLNRGIFNFMNSPESHRLKFFMEFCNHPPFGVPTEAKWKNCITVFIQAMKHPAYLRVDNKLVFKVHGGEQFIDQCSGYGCMDGDRSQIDFSRYLEMVELASERLEMLRSAVRQAGLGEMLVGGGLVDTLDQINKEHPFSKVYDFTNTYMDVLDGIAPSEKDYPYELLADKAKAWRHAHFKDAIPYVPFLPSGYNPRPWHDDQWRPSFKLPSRNQWRKELQRMKEDLRDLTGLGLPLSNGEMQKIFTIYAWNEFGEGGIVAPTQSDAYMKLECIKEVFGKE